MNKDYKKGKIMKQFNTYHGYASFYNVQILNFFNPEVQLQDTESAIRCKLRDLLTELKGFKFNS